MILKKYMGCLFLGTSLAFCTNLYAVKNTKNNISKKVSWSDQICTNNPEKSSSPHGTKEKKKKISQNSCPEKAFALGASAIFLCATLAPISASLWGITAMNHASITPHTITAYPYIPGGYANSSLLEPPIEKRPSCTYQDYFHDHMEPTYTDGSCFHLQGEYSCIIENCSTIKQLYTKARNTALACTIISLAAKCSAIAGITAWTAKEYSEAQKEPGLSIDSAIGEN